MPDPTYAKNYPFKYPKLRWEGPEWFYIDKSLPDDKQFVHTTDPERATQTKWVLTSMHPLDSHEFGIALTSIPDIHHSLDDLNPSYRAEAEDAMHRYMGEHPDGKDPGDA